MLSRQFLQGLLSTPRGRAYLLTQAGIAEETDEGAIFTQLEARVGDPELQRMVKRHAADEVRHATVFFAAADRQGVGRPHIPQEIQMLPLLNARLGLFARPLETDENVMEAYLLLQVLEERALEQFEVIEPAMRRFDPKAADDIASIAQDEERHLLYCRAIAKRYAPSPERLEQRLRAFREAEVRAFHEHQIKGLGHLLANGFLPAGKAWCWRNAVSLLSRAGTLPYTRYYGEVHAGPVAAAA
jgi:rubrerythrin